MKNLDVQFKDHYAIVKLDNGKGNPINLEMMQEIRQLFRQLTDIHTVRGVILTGKPPFFSVGLDIKELLNLDKKDSTHFFQEFHHMIFDLVKFPKPFITAITGHSPAGGCILAICSDYRVMAEGPYTIGLNEVPVGIMVTPYVFELYSFWVGKRNAYHNLLEGKLLRPEEGLAQGLLDAVVPVEQVLTEAEKKLNSWLQADQLTLEGVKKNIRLPLITAMEAQTKLQQINPVEHFWLPTSKQVLMNVLNRISKPKN